MFGPREQQGRGGGNGGAGHTQQVLTSTAAAVKDMGHQVAAGIQAALSASTQGSPQKGDGDKGGGLGGYGREYSKSHIAQLKGFCGTEDVRHIPAIWYTFSTTKDFDTYRVEIEGKMEQWGWDKGVEID